MILLVLVQLPKKDAGAGIAFGGGTADALFGAGSGNALTKITKWAAVTFLGLSLVLGWVQGASRTDTTAADFGKLVDQKAQQAAMPATPPAPQSAAPSAAPAGNGLLSTTIPMSATNATPAATNAAKSAK
ncbi:MAG: preprotein translocase subunit SecG [Verrucomicrobiae bacterium]|nr:preprotein translocase subunit SecG [Verrucomicrobiae bacterium]